MNILMMYTHNPLLTSGIIPMDLLYEFKNCGHNVKLLVNSHASDYPEDVVSMETSYLVQKKKLVNKIIKMVDLSKNVISDSKYHFHDLDEQKIYYKTTDILKKAKIKPDAIIIFFVKNFINVKNIYELYKITGAPIYWLTYDMAPLTGGCHYAWDCEGYQRNCGNCPGLLSSNPCDITFRNISYKKRYLGNTDIRVITATEWQYRQTKKSSLFKNHKIHKILIAFNKDIFKPVSKELIRKKLGISIEKKVIFFGAFGLDEERKGVEYLLHSLTILKDKLSKNNQLESKVLLLFAGNGFERIEASLPFEYRSLGMLDNTYGIASAYQMADIFVCPSVEDSGPTMINQSIMCGTPVVSFEMGVAIDLVINNKTGYRAKLRDSADFANGIYQILTMSDFDYQLMANNCRQLALELYEPSVNLNNWLQILTGDIESSKNYNNAGKHGV